MQPGVGAAVVDRHRFAEARDVDELRHVHGVERAATPEDDDKGHDNQDGTSHGGTLGPNPPTPFPDREGGERGFTLSEQREDSDPRCFTPPSLLGKGVGGLGLLHFTSHSTTFAASSLASDRVSLSAAPAAS